MFRSCHNSLLHGTGVWSVIRAALLGVCIGACAADEDEPEVTEVSSDSVEYNMDNEQLLGSARLTRTSEGILVVGEMEKVNPGESYTVWWVIFNSPENCLGANNPTPETGAFCGLPDFADEQLVPAGVAWGLCDGFVGSEGATFECARSIADSDVGFELSGITDPMNAEIHMILRTHGPTLPGEMGTKQITTYEGGCEEGDPNPELCEELSYIPFLPKVAACIPLHGRICP